MRQRLGIVAGSCLLVSLLFAIPARAARSRPLPAACDRSRPAVAFHPGTPDGAALLDRQPRPGPVACGATTGYAAIESRIAATDAGVVFSPATDAAGTTGVAVSTDGGTTWALTGDGGGIDDNLFADRDTGRIFWLKFKQGDATPPNREIGFSDDGGRTWTASEGCCVEGENSRLVTAPPPPGGEPTTNGYPNVVYLCSDTSLIGGVVYPAGGRVCSKSLDGGASFGTPKVLFSKPVPQHAECLPYGDYFGASEGDYPQAGRDGRLYVMVHCGVGSVVSSWLTSSDDEGEHWSKLIPIPYADELRVDSQNNLYLGRTNHDRPHPALDDAPLLQVSTDGGLSWSPSMSVTPPGVRAHSHHPEDNAFQTGGPAPDGTWPKEFTSYQWFMDVKEPGHVAFSFYGMQDGNDRWDAYISESRTALSADLVFWAAAVNPPTKSMSDGALAGQYSSGNEHVGAAIGQDGSPWGSFTDGTTGYAGRLFWPID
jgi:hypothetical protein